MIVGDESAEQEETQEEETGRERDKARPRRPNTSQEGTHENGTAGRPCRRVCEAGAASRYIPFPPSAAGYLSTVQTARIPSIRTYPCAALR